MEFKSVDEVLKFAIDKEKEAVDFYSSLADKAAQDSLKKVFKNFAKEEEKHAALLSDISGNKDKIEAYEFKAVADLKISDYMAETEYKEGMPMPDILKVAMKREEKAVALYADLGGKSGSKDAKKVFQILVQEESKHKLQLETMYDDYMADQEG